MDSEIFIESCYVYCSTSTSDVDEFMRLYVCMYVCMCVLHKRVLVPSCHVKALGLPANTIRGCGSGKPQSPTHSVVIIKFRSF